LNPYVSIITSSKDTRISDFMNNSIHILIVASPFIPVIESYNELSRIFTKFLVKGLNRFRTENSKIFFTVNQLFQYIKITIRKNLGLILTPV